MFIYSLIRILAVKDIHNSISKERGFHRHSFHRGLTNSMFGMDRGTIFTGVVRGKNNNGKGECLSSKGELK